jgi:hypothetical protein
MPSPFPGMNPYLENESIWADVHNTFLVALKEQLVPQITPHFIVVLERYIFVEEPTPQRPAQRLRADLLIASGGGHQPGVALLEPEAPIRVKHTDEEVERLVHLVIRRNGGGELVTIVELLSMANKRENQSQYRAKRATILDSPTHLVEIDLLRGGRPMPDLDRPPCDYSVMVSRAGHRPSAGFWPISLKDRLPTIPIPLSRAIPDAHVDLQAILNRIYDTSGYDSYIYQDEPEPPLSADDAEWARAFAPTAR